MSFFLAGDVMALAIPLRAWYSCRRAPIRLFIAPFILALVCPTLADNRVTVRRQGPSQVDPLIALLLRLPE
jgi:hypothetical protein